MNDKVMGELRGKVDFFFFFDFFGGSRERLKHFILIS